jgi:hypothetical protein
MYRPKAVELLMKAQAAKDEITRAVYENLALSYLRLSELARRNIQTDIVYEPPAQKPDGKAPETRGGET